MQFCREGLFSKRGKDLAGFKQTSLNKFTRLQTERVLAREHVAGHGDGAGMFLIICFCFFFVIALPDAS